VMLCVHAQQGTFNESELREIVASGRRAGIWTWYCVSNEIMPSMFGRTRALKEFFDALPADSTDLVAWQSVDNNNHILNLDSLYVCARLMCDRAADSKVAQREFLVGALGAENASNAQFALQAIESLRPFWPQEYGDQPLDAGLALRAEQAARRITVAPGFAPTFPLPVCPAEYAEEIVRQTEALREFADFSVAAAEAEKRKPSANAAEREAVLQSLPRLTKPTRWMTNLEWCRHLARIKSLRKVPAS